MLSPSHLLGATDGILTEKIKQSTWSVLRPFIRILNHQGKYPDTEDGNQNRKPYVTMKWKQKCVCGIALIFLFWGFLH